MEVWYTPQQIIALNKTAVEVDDMDDWLHSLCYMAVIIHSYHSPGASLAQLSIRIPDDTSKVFRHNVYR